MYGVVYIEHSVIWYSFDMGHYAAAAGCADAAVDGSGEDTCCDAAAAPSFACFSKAAADLGNFILLKWVRHSHNTNRQSTHRSFIHWTTFSASVYLFALTRPLNRVVYATPSCRTVSHQQRHAAGDAQGACGVSPGRGSAWRHCPGP